MYAQVLIAIYSVAITVAMYAFSRLLAKNYPSALTTPAFLGTLMVILVLQASGLRYQDYAPARDILSLLLGPVIVALAIPLYKNRHVLSTHAAPLLIGLAAGTAATLFAAVAVAKLGDASQIILSSMVLKSAVAPIAVETARVLDGSPSVTALLVIVGGMIGAMLGPWLMNAVGVRHPLARGLSLGMVAHTQGAVPATAEGELAGAIASVAMVVAAVVTAWIAPVLV